VPMTPVGWNVEEEKAVGPTMTPLLLRIEVGNRELTAVPMIAVLDVEFEAVTPVLSGMAVLEGAVLKGILVVRAVPIGAVPSGAVPKGAVPRGAVPLGAVPFLGGFVLFCAQ